jgi:hypothetical protein
MAHDEKAYKKAWAEANKDRIAANRRAWVEQNKGRVSEYGKKYYDSLSPEKRKHKTALQRNSTLKRKYGITLEQYVDMFKAQGGMCAICRKPGFNGKYRQANWGPLNVDHCHKTGKVRGLLCSSCNFVIGLFDDDPKVFERAIDYLSSEEDGA